MIEPTGAQLKPLAKLLLLADKHGFSVAVEQMAPKHTLSLWRGDKSQLWYELTPGGAYNYMGDR